MANMKPPRVPEQLVPVVPADDLRTLLAACEGKAFDDRRDTAMLRMLIGTGMRTGEPVGMQVSDIARDTQVAFVVGKGRRPRACPYGAKAAAAIDRYFRVRNRQPYVASEWLWVGKKRRVTDSGLPQLLERRAEQAGIPRIHPDQLRHTYAHAFFSEGRNEGDLTMLAETCALEPCSSQTGSSTSSPTRSPPASKSPGTAARRYSCAELHSRLPRISRYRCAPGQRRRNHVVRSRTRRHTRPARPDDQPPRARLSLELHS
jgi:hypothetical protein